MSSKLVAVIIGAGSNVGGSVAQTLAKQNYQVAVGARTTRDKVPEGYYPFSVDVTKPESIKPAFEKVVADIGPPNVVIFNAATLVPADAEDPLSFPLSKFNQGHTVTESFYIAAQEALASFRSPVHKESPKAFIVTGNLLAFVPAAANTAPQFGLGLQKRSEAYLTELFHNVYGIEGIRFHYAHLVSAEGGIPPYTDFLTSGAAHAKAYAHLINAPAPEAWDYRFTSDGEKYVPK
ncbi:hypothetical protein BDZ89DRAFT_1120102 [Hymenopellis radicata]|nr:hypothetical protein BDZ89DRAFT_1120102 [Hymenopellis radicata]